MQNTSNEAFPRRGVPFGVRNKNLTLKPLIPENYYFGAQIWRHRKYPAEKHFTVGDAPCEIPLIIIEAPTKPHKSYVVYMQITVIDYKYVVSDDDLPPGRVSRRMRIANFAIKMSYWHCFHPLLHKGSS